MSIERFREIEQYTPEWEAVRESCRSLFFFTKTIWCDHLVMPEENKMSKRCHLVPCLLLEDPAIDRILFEWPRRFLKTTLVESYTVHTHVKDVLDGREPYKRIGIYSAKDENAKRIWREIKFGFEVNKALRFFFPELIPNTSGKDNPQWNSDGGYLPSSMRRKDPHFDTLSGSGGSATGRHYDVVVLDDMVNEKNYRSELEIAAVIEHFVGVNNLLEDAAGRVVVVGNRWTMRDLNAFIRKERPRYAILCASGYRPRLDLCRNLPEPLMERLHNVDDGNPLWPERFGLPELEAWAQELGPRHASAHIMNDPSDPDATDFRAEWLRACEVTETPDGEPAVKFQDDDVLVPFSDLNVVVTLDPALGAKHSESQSAIVISAMDARGRVAVLRAYCTKDSYKNVLMKFIAFCKLYGRWLLASGVEEVLFQSVLKDIIREKADDKHVYLRLRPVKTPRGQSKDQRIRAKLGTYFEDRRIYITTACHELVDDYLHFGIEGARRDCIDALAYAADLWRRPVEGSRNDDEADSWLSYSPTSPDLGDTGYGDCWAN